MILQTKQLFSNKCGNFDTSLAYLTSVISHRAAFQIRKAGTPIARLLTSVSFVKLKANARDTELIKLLIGPKSSLHVPYVSVGR